MLLLLTGGRLLSGVLAATNLSTSDQHHGLNNINCCLYYCCYINSQLWWAGYSLLEERK